MRVNGATLPGLGRRFELLTRDGRRLGVIAYRSGHRDLVVHDSPSWSTTNVTERAKFFKALRSRVVDSL